MTGASPVTTIDGPRRSQRGIVVAPLAGAMPVSDHLCQTLPPCALHRPGSDEYKNVPGTAGIIGRYSFYSLRAGRVTWDGRSRAIHRAQGWGKTHINLFISIIAPVRGEVSQARLSPLPSAINVAPTPHHVTSTGDPANIHPSHGVPCPGERI